MIPPFDNSGYLPPGIHPATLDEIAARFGRGSETREAQIESIRCMVDLAIRAGVDRIILNGSFVTDIMEPNDVDCVLLLRRGRLRDRAARRVLVKGLPYLEMSIVRPREFDRMVDISSPRTGTGQRRAWSR